MIVCRQFNKKIMLGLTCNPSSKNINLSEYGKWLGEKNFFRATMKSSNDIVKKKKKYYVQQWAGVLYLFFKELNLLLKQQSVSLSARRFEYLSIGSQICKCADFFFFFLHLTCMYVHMSRRHRGDILSRAERHLILRKIRLLNTETEIIVASADKLRIVRPHPSRSHKVRKEEACEGDARRRTRSRNLRTRQE